MFIRSFKDLIVWQKSHYFVLRIYSLTKKFPSHEQFGLTNQIKRSASSVPTNIVEGYKRTAKEFLRFLKILHFLRFLSIFVDCFVDFREFLIFL